VPNHLLCSPCFSADGRTKEENEEEKDVLSRKKGEERIIKK
jgi:hypothetical protein